MLGLAFAASVKHFWQKLQLLNKTKQAEKPRFLIMLLIPRTKPRPGDVSDLLTESEFRYDCTITLNVLLLEIVEKVAALTDHLEKTTTAVIVLVVNLKMLCELRDALCKNSDLYLRRTGIGIVEAVICDNLCLLFLKNHCFFTFLYIFPCIEVSGG